MYLFICLFALLMFRDCKVSTPQPEITRSTIIGQHQVLLAYYPQENPYSFSFTRALLPATTTTTKTHNQMLKRINYLHSMAYSVHIGQKLLNRQIVTYFHILFMAAVFFPPLLNFRELSHKSTIHFSWNNSNRGYQSIFKPFFNQKQVNIYLLLIEFKMMLNIIEMLIPFIYLAKIVFKITRLESALQKKKRIARTC